MIAVAIAHQAQIVTRRSVPHSGHGQSSPCAIGLCLNHHNLLRLKFCFQLAVALPYVMCLRHGRKTMCNRANTAVTTSTLLTLGNDAHSNFRRGVLADVGDHIGYLSLETVSSHGTISP